MFRTCGANVLFALDRYGRFVINLDSGKFAVPERLSKQMPGFDQSRNFVPETPIELAKIAIQCPRRSPIKRHGSELKAKS
jgi:hypothetical protein